MMEDSSADRLLNRLMEHRYEEKTGDSDKA